MEHMLKEIEELACDVKLEIEGEHRLRAHDLLNRIIDLCCLRESRG